MPICKEKLTVKGKFIFKLLFPSKSNTVLFSKVSAEMRSHCLCCLFGGIKVSNQKTTGKSILLLVCNATSQEFSTWLCRMFSHRIREKRSFVSPPLRYRSESVSPDPAVSCGLRAVRFVDLFSVLINFKTDFYLGANCTDFDLCVLIMIKLVFWVATSPTSEHLPTWPPTHLTTTPPPTCRCQFLLSLLAGAGAFQGD